MSAAVAQRPREASSSTSPHVETSTLPLDNAASQSSDGSNAPGPYGDPSGTKDHHKPSHVSPLRAVTPLGEASDASEPAHSPVRSGGSVTAESARASSPIEEPPEESMDGGSPVNSSASQTAESPRVEPSLREAPLDLYDDGSPDVKSEVLAHDSPSDDIMPLPQESADVASPNLGRTSLSPVAPSLDHSPSQPSQPIRMSPQRSSLKRKSPLSADGPPKIRLRLAEANNTSPSPAPPPALNASDEMQVGSRTRSRSPIKGGMPVNIPDPPSIPSKRRKEASPAKDGLSVAARRAPRKKRKWLKKGQVDPDDPVAVAKQKERFAVIDNALLDLDRQEEMIENGTHEQLQILMKALDERFEKQMRKHTDTRLAFEEEMEYSTECEDLFTRSTWHHHRCNIMNEMVDANQRRFNQLDREDNFLDKPLGKLSDRNAKYGQGGWGVFIDRLFSKGTVPLAPVYTHGGRRVGYRRDIGVAPDYLEPRARVADTHDIGLRVAKIMLPWSNAENRPPQGPGLYPTAPSLAWPTYYALQRREEDWNWILSSDRINRALDEFDAKEEEWKAQVKAELKSHDAADDEKVKSRLATLQTALKEEHESDQVKKREQGRQISSAGPSSETQQTRHGAVTSTPAAPAQSATQAGRTVPQKSASTQSRPASHTVTASRAAPAPPTRAETSAGPATTPVARTQTASASPIVSRSMPAPAPPQRQQQPTQQTSSAQPRVAPTSAAPAISSVKAAGSTPSPAPARPQPAPPSNTSNSARPADQDARAATSGQAKPSAASAQKTTAMPVSASAPMAQTTSAAPTAKSAGPPPPVRGFAPSRPAMGQTQSANPSTAAATSAPSTSLTSSKATDVPAASARAEQPAVKSKEPIGTVDSAKPDSAAKLANGTTPSVLEPPRPSAQPDVEPEDPWKAIQTTARFKSLYDSSSAGRPSATPPINPFPHRQGSFASPSQTSSMAIPSPSFGVKSASPWGGPSSAAAPLPPLPNSLQRQSSGSFGLDRPSPFGAVKVVRAPSGACLPAGVTAIRPLTDEMLEESEPKPVQAPTDSQLANLGRRTREDNVQYVRCTPRTDDPVVPTIQYVASEDRYLWRANKEWGMMYEREDAILECHKRWDAAEDSTASMTAAKEVIMAANRTGRAEAERKARVAVLRTKLEDRENRRLNGESITSSQANLRIAEEDELMSLMTAGEKDAFRRTHTRTWWRYMQRQDARSAAEMKRSLDVENQKFRDRREQEAQEEAEKIKREKAEKRNAQARERRRLKKLEDQRLKGLTAENLAKLNAAHEKGPGQGSGTPVPKDSRPASTAVSTPQPASKPAPLSTEKAASAPRTAASGNPNIPARPAAAPVLGPSAVAAQSAQGNMRQVSASSAPVRAPNPAPTRAAAPAGTPVLARNPAPVAEAGAAPMRTPAPTAAAGSARTSAPGANPAPARTPVTVAATIPVRDAAPAAAPAPARASAPTASAAPAAHPASVRASAPAPAPRPQQTSASTSAPAPTAARAPCAGCGRIH